MRSSVLLFAIAALLASPIVASAQELSRNQVFELQFRLNQLGYEAGRLDGQIGGRTRAAAYRFADAHDTRADLNPAFLAQVRAAARPIEGIASDDGFLDLLVFSENDAPLILRVDTIGRLGEAALPPAQLETSSTETDGALQTSGDVLTPGDSFGIRVRAPAVPEGDRLAVTQIVSEPKRLADGTVRFTEHVTEHVITGGAPSLRQWAWTGVASAQAERSAPWRFTIENGGDILLTRTFRIAR